MIQKDRGDIIKDTIVKEYIGNPEIFADVFNFFLYDGEQKINPENLTEKDVTELVTLPAAIKGQELSREVDVSIKRSQMHKRSKRKTDGSNSAQKHRDLLKFAAMMQDSYANYVILGVENQMEVHYAMPVRNMVYDALQYDKQVAMIAAANVINTVAGIGLEIRQDRGKVDMCKAIEDMKAESREEGRTKGRAETIGQTVTMLRNMKIPKETILSELQKTFSISEEEANRIYSTK